jgi:hypothetical protein
MPTKNTAAADPLKEAREELVKACNERRQVRDRLIGACGSVVLTQAGFSDDDDWTKEDEMRARCIDSMFSIVNDLAAELVKANEAHDKQLAFLNKLHDSQRKTES